jgi:hypothetical protein
LFVFVNPAPELGDIGALMLALGAVCLSLLVSATQSVALALQNRQSYNFVTTLAEVLTGGHVIKSVVFSGNS